MEYRISLHMTDGKKIYVDPGFCDGVYLYPGEVKKKKLVDGQVLSEEELSDLREEFGIPRAKKRALGILAKRDKTEAEIRKKLAESLTDPVSLEAAMDFVRSFGYVDDYRYSCDYLRNKRRRKSFRVIRMELSQKGIPGQILDEVFEEAGDQELSDVREQIRKYSKRFPKLDWEAQQKIQGHFYRKGYDGGLIRRILEEFPEEE